MCGLAGVARRTPGPEIVSPDLVSRMAAAIGHRGPDGFGVHTDLRVGLAHVRLSVIDVAGGAQPMSSGSGNLVVVYNGEIFDFPALRRELTALGHRFRTRCDTEILLHAYEQWGEAMLHHLNGQFAFVLYDRARGSLFLARDRFGILPLYYAERGGDLYFASEIRGILASEAVPAVLDPQGLDEVFTFWAARPPRTVFQGIRALLPGGCARWRDGRLDVRRWFTPDFAEAAEMPDSSDAMLDELLRAAVATRLEADVPVGAYLSGGVDSSVVCAAAQAASGTPLRTYSVGFDDPLLDESSHQLLVADQLGTDHASRRIGADDIATVFPDVVRHAETPLLRTAAAPLYLLSQLVRERGLKVVLSGEGADELFLGYDLFKETALRLFCLRQPQSQVRPRLFDRLYPYLAPGGRGGDFWRGYFLSAGEASDPLFTHLPRFRFAEWMRNFYSVELRAELGRFDPLAELAADLPPASTRWSALGRAAYLETTTLLAPYLLASQGDRMGMAHGVEIRVPFLDHRLFEFVAALPSRAKLRGLSDKRPLRRWASRVLPSAVTARPKHPYRAPDAPAFFTPRSPEYVRALLDPKAVERVGLFDPTAVAGLVRRCLAGRPLGVREHQALVGILSTHLWHHHFEEGAWSNAPRTSSRSSRAPGNGCVSIFSTCVPSGDSGSTIRCCATA